MTRSPRQRHLPPDVTIEHLPWIGTTWYERGTEYWLRRVAGTMAATAVLAVYTGLAGTFIHHAGPAGSPRFIAILAAEVPVALITGTRHFRRTQKQPHRPPSRNLNAAITMDRACKILALAIAAVAVAGLVTGHPDAGVVTLLWVTSAFCLATYGPCLAAFVTLLMPVLPAEREARRRLAEQLHRHGDQARDTAGHHHGHLHDRR